MSANTCEFGAVNCHEPSVAITMVEGGIGVWPEARCKDHLCDSYEEHEQ